MGITTFGGSELRAFFAGSWDQGILGDPGAASRDDGIFMAESLQQERESPWALTLTERVPEAFEFSPSDWPQKYFSGQSLALKICDTFDKSAVKNSL